MVDGSDKIELPRSAAEVLKDIEYQRTANFSQRVGVSVAPQDPLPAHAGSIAMPSGNQVAALFGGAEVAVTSTETSVGSGTNGFGLVAVEVNSSNVLQKQWVLQVADGAALQQGSSYSCKRGSGAETMITFQPSANVIYRSDFGGRCSVTITHLAIANGAISELEGTFTAELGAFTHDTVLIRDGVFRWFKP